LAYDAGICEENVQSAVLADCFVDDSYHSFFIGGIERSYVDVHAWIQ
jgi:hypothetical protein